MPDRRRHRGAHPEDRDRFSPAFAPALQAAARELAWLLDRDHSLVAATKLVGDRHRLDARQRLAVQRATCTSTARATRLARRVAAPTLCGRSLWIDGFNVLITLESALAGAILLRCRDGCLRDMASLHGNYRLVTETTGAAAALLHTLARLHVGAARVLLDAPVSNSGRLRSALLALAADAHIPFEVEVRADVDDALRHAPEDVVVATADAGVLDRCGPWFDLASAVLSDVTTALHVLRLADG